MSKALKQIIFFFGIHLQDENCVDNKYCIPSASSDQAIIKYSDSI